MEAHSLTRRQLEDYRSHLQAEEKSTATQEAYMRTALAFFADSAGAVTKASAAVYKRRLLAGGYAVRTVNARLAALNGLFGFLGWHECRLKTVRTQRDVFRTEKRELGQAEYARLCRAAERRRNRRLCLLLQTICGTGIRVGELAFVTVEAVRAGEVAVSCKGKVRRVLLVRALREKLLRYAADIGAVEGPVFRTRTGRPLHRTNIWREMKALCGEAGVEPQKVFPHNLRHLFARTFYNLEKNISKLADLLGHSSIETTRIYIMESGAEHERLLNKMHLLL